MEADRRIVVERLCDLGDWEIYRFADEVSDEPVSKIALNVGGETVEYGVWRMDDAEPSATGALAWEDDADWDDGARERLLRQIAQIYEEGMPEVRKGLAFHIGVLDDDDHDDGDDDHDDED